MGCPYLSLCKPLIVALIGAQQSYPLGHLGHGPPFTKYLGHLGHAPLWCLEIVISHLNYLLQVEHLMYRLKYPFGWPIHYYHLCLTNCCLLSLWLCGLHVASMFDIYDLLIYVMLGRLVLGAH